MHEVLIFSGAGLSAESGIPTFRDAGGLWYGHDPRVVASIDTLDDHRELVFRFYNERRTKLPTVAPNLAHRWIADLQKRLGSRLKLFTQNVDDLLERSGCADVVHLHGSLLNAMCRSCGQTWQVGYSVVSPEERCPHCGSSRTKPGVVMFGEEAPLYRDMHEIFGKSRNDLIIVIGTSGNVIPFDYVVGNRRSTRRSTTVLVNRDRDPTVPYHKYFDQVLFKPVTEAIQDLEGTIARWENERSRTSVFE